MAAITASDVADVQTWRQPVCGGKTILHRILDITLSGNGGTANDIPASTLGFEQIWGATSMGLVATSGGALHCVPVVVEDDKEGILTINIEDSTDGTRSDPANTPINGDLRVHVWGIDLQ